MRNISFSLTTPQFRARTKDVTRRLGWKTLKPGDRLMGCVKCMGRKPGEPLERLGEIEVVSVRREPLNAITASDCAREGFADHPQLSTPNFFVDFFCATHKRIAELERENAALNATCAKYERTMALLRKERDAYFSRLCQYEVPPTPNEIDAAARDGIRPNSPFTHHHV